MEGGRPISARGTGAGIWPVGAGVVDLVPEPAHRRPMLFLLSGFELRWGDEVLPVPNGSQRLLAFLALQDRPVPRSFVGGSLWPDTTEERAAACLRSAMWRVPALGSPSVVIATTTHVRLNPETRVDYQESGALATALLRGEEVGGPWSLLARFCQELLPGWYDEWALIERERFRQLRLHAIEEIGERLIRQGAHAQALMAALTAVAADPLRESAQRLVVRAHLAEGNVVEALRQFQNYSDTLHRELGLEPSAAMRELVPSAMTRNQHP